MSTFSSELENILECIQNKVRRSDNIVDVEYSADTAPFIKVTTTYEKTPVYDKYKVVSSKQKLGKLLAEHIKDNTRVRHLVEEYKEPLKDFDKYVVEYSTDYVEVYQHPLYAIGSTTVSCMLGKECVQVYAGDDRLKLLLIRNLKGEIVARTLVRFDTANYIRIYIDHNKIRSNLAIAIVTQAGFTYGDLEGIKLAKVEADNGFLMLPYLDGNVDSVNEDDDFLIISINGKIQATTSGYIGRMCDSCNCPCMELFWVESEDREICTDCLDEYVYLDGEGYMHVDNCVTNNSTDELVSESYANRHLCMTEENGYYDWDDVVETEDGYYPANSSQVVQLVETADDYEYALKRYCTYNDGYSFGKKGWYHDDYYNELETEYNSETEED